MRDGMHPLSALLELSRLASEAKVLPPEAVAEMLQERLAELQQGNHFMAGQLVTFKTGFDIRKPEYAAHPLAVIGYDLSGYPPPAPRRENHYVERADIALLDLREDGTAAIRIVDSRMLTPWPLPAAPVAESEAA